MLKNKVFKRHTICKKGILQICFILKHQNLDTLTIKCLLK